jgi:hypothetical protein
MNLVLKVLLSIIPVLSYANNFVITCKNTSSRPGVFGFKQLDLACQEAPNELSSQYQSFKNCKVIYTRHSNILVTTTTLAFGKMTSTGGINKGYVTVLPQVFPAFSNSQADAYNGFRLSWSDETYPNAMTLDACVATKNSKYKNQGYCINPLNIRTLGMTCVTQFQSAM